MSASVRPPFPKIIDATSRKDLVSCAYKFWIKRVRKLKYRGTSPHLHFGGCYAKGLEITRKAYYGEKLPEDTAICLGGEAIINQWGDYSPPEVGSARLKTMSACLEVHSDYFREYPFDEDFLRPVIGEDGKPAVEFSFAVPIPDLVHPEGGPILYAGKFDMLAEHVEQDGFFIDDEKTAGQLGDAWAKNWVLASQMTGYKWGAEQFGFPISGICIRGVSVQVKGIKHVQIIEQRDNWMVDRWLKQLQRDVQRAVRMWEDDYWDLALDDACSSYGGCDLLGVCTSKNPERWLAADFEDDDWSPLKDDHV